MELQPKDVVYVVVYLLSMGGAFLTFRTRLGELERKVASDSCIIYGDRGTLNVIDRNTCEKHRLMLDERIRLAENYNQSISNDIRTLNGNVQLIMFHLNITPPNMAAIRTEKEI